MLSPSAIRINSNINFNNRESENKRKVKPVTDSSLNGNPISRKGETMKLITATFVAGLAVAGRLLFELVDNGDFLIEIFDSLANKISKKNVNKTEIDKIISEAKNKTKASHDKKILSSIGIFASLVAVFLCGFALLYTAFNAPKISYESKVNSFQKGKEMDVYIKANEVEKELYTQLDEKAKSSSTEEKEALKEQYLKMKNAKNQVPDFVNLKLDKKS